MQVHNTFVLSSPSDPFSLFSTSFLQMRCVQGGMRASGFEVWPTQQHMAVPLVVVVTVEIAIMAPIMSLQRFN